MGMIAHVGALCQAAGGLRVGALHDGWIDQGRATAATTARRARARPTPGGNSASASLARPRGGGLLRKRSCAARRGRVRRRFGQAAGCAPRRQSPTRMGTRSISRKRRRQACFTNVGWPSRPPCFAGRGPTGTVNRQPELAAEPALDPRRAEIPRALRAARPARRWAVGGGRTCEARTRAHSSAVRASCGCTPCGQAPRRRLDRSRRARAAITAPPALDADAVSKDNRTTGCVNPECCPRIRHSRRRKEAPCRMRGSLP